MNLAYLKQPASSAFPVLRTARPRAGRLVGADGIEPPTFAL
jgi:hypothetical protein